MSPFDTRRNAGFLMNGLEQVNTGVQIFRRTFKWDEQAVAPSNVRIEVFSRPWEGPAF